MAEALPRYRKAGVMLADIPRIDFGDRRESARSLATLDDRLGQLSQWALGEAADRAKDEGLQYGAENPVTIQQLKDGTAHFQPRNTIFGDAARSAQVEAITADLALDADARINQLKIGVERGTVSLPEAQGEIQAMLDGNGKALTNIDPKASGKLRARIGASGNSAMLAMTQDAIKRETENRKIAVDGWLADQVAEQVRAHVQAGDTVDPESGKVITAQDRINATLRSTLVAQLVNIGDDVYARQARATFEKIVKEAQIDALVKVVQTPDFARDRDGRFDPVLAQVRVDKGDLGIYSKMFAAMPTDEQAKVRDNLRKVSADRWTADQHARAEAKHADTLETNRLVAQYPTAPGPQKRQIEAALKAISVRSDAISGQAINALIKSAKEGDGTGKNDAAEVAETRLRMDVLAGRIRTPEQLWEQGLRYGVKPKQVNEVLGFFVTRQNRSESEAARIAMRAAGLTTSMINPAQHRAQALLSIEQQIESQFGKAMEAHRNDPAKNPAPDRVAIAEGIARKRQEHPLTKGIETTLKFLNEQYGPNGATKKSGVTFTDDSNPEEVRRALTAAGVSKAHVEEAIKHLGAIEQKRQQLNQLRN